MRQPLGDPSAPPLVQVCRIGHALLSRFAPSNDAIEEAAQTYSLSRPAAATDVVESLGDLLACAVAILAFNVLPRDRHREVVLAAALRGLLSRFASASGQSFGYCASASSEFVKERLIPNPGSHDSGQRIPESASV